MPRAIPANPADRSWSDEERRLRSDALLAWWPYADGSLRATVEALLADAQRDAWDEANETQLLACAAATWPPRVAARRFASEHPDRFSALFLPRCLASTQILLKRLEEQEGTVALPALLAAPQADFALHESERLEIGLLLPQAYALLWAEAAGEMAAHVETATGEREAKRALLGQGSVQPGAASLFDHDMMYGEDVA